MVTETERKIVVEMVQRIDYLIAVLEPAEKLDKEIVKLDSVFDMRFRWYTHGIREIHDLMRDVEKIDKKKPWDYNAAKRNTDKIGERIRYTRNLLPEILNVVKRIYNDESAEYNTFHLATRFLEQIKQDEDDASHIRPLLSDLEHIDSNIVECRRSIAAISVELQRVYREISKMYALLKHEEFLMDSFYLKVEKEVERTKHLEGGFSGREKFFKEFEELDREMERRIEELFKLKNEGLRTIHHIKEEAASSYRVHEMERKKLLDIKNSLRSSGASKNLVF